MSSLCKITICPGPYMARISCFHLLAATPCLPGFKGCTMTTGETSGHAVCNHTGHQGGPKTCYWKPSWYADILVDDTIIFTTPPRFGKAGGWISGLLRYARYFVRDRCQSGSSPALGSRSFGRFSIGYRDRLRAAEPLPPGPPNHRLWVLGDSLHQILPTSGINDAISLRDSHPATDEKPSLCFLPTPTDLRTSVLPTVHLDRRRRRLHLGGSVRDALSTCPSRHAVKPFSATGLSAELVGYTRSRPPSVHRNATHCGMDGGLAG